MRAGSVPMFSALLAIIVVGLAVTNLYGLKAGVSTHAARLEMKYALQNYATQPDEGLRSMYPPSVDTLRARAAFMQNQKLGAFSEPRMDALLLTLHEDGMMVGEIIGERPVVQTFTCPVQTLKDIQLLFSTYGRDNTSHFEITLAGGNQPLLQQSFQSGMIRDNEWVSAVLPKPIENCTGDNLVLSVTSTDGTPGNAITVWAYPRYYEGRIEQPQTQALADRVMALTVNASASGLSILNR